MRLHRLEVRNFAAVREIAIDLGPGLNVLYGPNDLGKSTLAQAIRLVLLLPPTSTHGEPYTPWSGAGDPLVELTFETEPERFWRVRKLFAKRGTAILQESRNGQDFETVETGRRVDAKLREILRWGIPEPGGAGAPKGLPASFLATALLSTQTGVADVLRGSLEDDPAATGKERIAAALQAVAQDPLFVALLREAQGRRDEAYTDKGAKKTARGSVFKVAAERVKEAREEKERLAKIVEESEGVERRLRDLRNERARLDQEHAAATEWVATVELLAQQCADRAVAAEQVRVAEEAVARIQAIDQEVAAAERQVHELAEQKDQAGIALAAAQAAVTAAGEALAAAEDRARSAGLDSNQADVMARQALDLRRAAAERAAQEARQGIAAAAAARERMAAARQTELDCQGQEAAAQSARDAKAQAARTEEEANARLRRCDLLERGLEARSADRRVAAAQAEVDREAALQAEHAQVTAERSALATERSALRVPPAGSIPALRKLETDLARAHGALNVGLVMTVIPTAIVQLRVRTDGAAASQDAIAKPLEIEANTEVEVEIGDLATVRVRGGRREAQETARALEGRWDREALPHLQAAGVADLEALEARIAEARELDARLQAVDGRLASLRSPLDALGGATAALHDATARAAACQEELAGVTLEMLAAELDALGSDPGAGLRNRRQQASRDAETARALSQNAATAQTLAEERARSLRANLEAAVATRDADLAAVAVEAAAEQDRRTAEGDLETIAAEVASLQSEIEAKRRTLDAALAEARGAVERAARGLDAAQKDLQQAIADQSSEEGRVATLRTLRAAEDLPAAERALRAATERHAALPVPERSIRPEDVVAAKGAAARARTALAGVEKELHTAQGALQQVGGAVAGDQLRQATEALDLAESLEREIEADYEAWRLLLETMKEAEAAQESNLGQALAPALAERFQALTRKRYESVELTPHLATQGVVVAGAVRSTEQISVGTREQLSTLYRLCLGEYLQTAVVLDDQLVQSDDTRMEWFRALLAEKARSFQIVVFTCRPADYLAAKAMVKKAGTVALDSDGGFVRAIDLGRAVGG